MDQSAKKLKLYSGFPARADVTLTIDLRVLAPGVWRRAMKKKRDYSRFNYSIGDRAGHCRDGDRDHDPDDGAFYLGEWKR